MTGIIRQIEYSFFIVCWKAFAKQFFNMIHILIGAQDDGYFLNQTNSRRSQFFQNLRSKSDKVHRPT